MLRRLIKILAFLILGLNSIYAFNASVYDRHDQSYCIVLEADISGSAEYLDTKTLKKKTIDFNIVNNNSMIFGTCNFAWHDTTPNRTLQFLEISVEQYGLDFSILFDRKDDDQENSFKLLNYQVIAWFSPELHASVNRTVYLAPNGSKIVWSAEDKKAFSCSSSELAMTDRFGYKATLKLENLKVIAFAQTDVGIFKPGQKFDGCSPDFWWPFIIIGIVLAMSIFVASIIFMVKMRARPRTENYEELE